MTEISTVTKWILNGETVLEEEERVKITTKSGEVVIGEVVSLDNSSINIDSDNMGDIYVDINLIQEIEKE